MLAGPLFLTEVLSAQVKAQHVDGSWGILIVVHLVGTGKVNTEATRSRACRHLLHFAIAV